VEYSLNIESGISPIALAVVRLSRKPGVVTSGDGARGALEQFLAIGLAITINVRNVHAVGDIP